MAVELARPEVADKYECTLDTDVMIHAKGYSGKISGVNLSGAEHLVRSKTGYLVEKQAPAGEAVETTKKTGSKKTNPDPENQ